MTVRWLFLASGVFYLAFVTVFWTIIRMAALADRAITALDDDPHLACPVCDSPNVCVDTDHFVLCLTCKAAFPETAGVAR